jgi:hypothetical protein
MNDVQPITIPAMGYSEHVTLHIPADLHPDVMRVSSYLVYGPDFDRRIFDTLVDVSRIWRRGDYPDEARRRFAAIYRWAAQNAHGEALAGR